MRMLVIGASKGTGALAVKAALERGHDATAFARNPDRLDVQHPRLTRRAGDFHDQASVTAAMAGHDAVIVTASSPSLRGFKEKPDYFSRGTGNVITAMKGQGVRRLVVLSALGVGESRKLVNFVVDRLVVSWLLKGPFVDHESNTVIRPAGDGATHCLPPADQRSQRNDAAQAFVLTVVCGGENIS